MAHVEHVLTTVVSFFMFDEGSISIEDNETYAVWFPEKLDTEKPRCYDLKIQPSAYLTKMIKINILASECTRGVQSYQ